MDVVVRVFRELPFVVSKSAQAFAYSFGVAVVFRTTIVPAVLRCFTFRETCATLSAYE
ncbi:hypothetical protein HSB1_22990 [Halogranum salarium B-1]|uniref:Uncharacterized protein n=1 Tax=Halogranum salarium B-1 TaxID=1210908 RepID=J3A0M1_9EURY|nr:hypothetical protein HSB1_22990 [Halogranum salarium B-1]